MGKKKKKHKHKHKDTGEKKSGKIRASDINGEIETVLTFKDKESGKSIGSSTVLDFTPKTSKRWFGAEFLFAMRTFRKMKLQVLRKAPKE